MNLMSRKFGLKKLLDLAALSMITVQKQWKLNAVQFMACFYKYWQVCGAGRIVNEHSLPFLSGKTQKR